ncbi:MAG: hypothetical protein M1445_01695, partial [Bacteroidetes bacterium]|nr:hypothetical protein [Bacteroidota bacterium]
KSFLITSMNPGVIESVFILIVVSITSIFDKVNHLQFIRITRTGGGTCGYERITVRDEMVVD